MASQSIFFKTCKNDIFLTIYHFLPLYVRSKTSNSANLSSTGRTRTLKKLLRTWDKVIMFKWTNGSKIEQENVLSELHKYKHGQKNNRQRIYAERIDLSSA